MILSLFVFSAILLTVIQAPIGWSFLAWVALVPFALACSPVVRPRRFALLAFVVGYLYWLGNAYWIVPITIIGWLAMSLYLAVFWVLPALAVRFARTKGLPLFVALPILVAGWERLQGFPMGGFYWRFLGHSQYQNLAMIQIADILGAAGVSFVVAMVNGLLADLILAARARASNRPIVCLSDTPPEAIHVRPWQVWTILRFVIRDAVPTVLAGGKAASVKSLSLRTGVVIVTVAATFLYGHWRLGQAQQCVTEGPLIASLQSNVPQSVKRSHEKSVDIFDELMDKSKAAQAQGAELIVWPETMVQGLLDPALWPYLQGYEEGEFEQDKAFHQALCAHAKDKAYVLVGAPGGEIMKDASGKLFLGKLNSAYFYRPSGTRDPGRYDKIHLVLFGEYIPFKKWFPWLFEQLKVFLPKGWNPNYSLEHGTRYTIFEMAAPTGGRRAEDGGQKTADGTPSSNPQSAIMSSPAPTGDRNPQSGRVAPYHFAVIICYEDTIPYVGRNFALDPQGRKRVDWLVNISNDGWFVRFQEEPARVIPSTELPQHAAICAFRAVENRLPIVRSVNTGISCLIESTGRIREGYLAASDNFPRRTMDRTAMAGWFLDRLPIDKRVTFYSRHGEWFADGCAVLFAAALVWPLGTRLVMRRAKARQAS